MRQFPVKLILFSLSALGIVSGVVAETKNSDAERDSRMKDSNAQNPGSVCQLPSNDEDLRRLLSPEQYYVTKQNGTERPFQNAFWNNHEPGIYVDVISGEPLFSSLDKFDSGTGWPSFTKPIVAGVVAEKSDVSHGMVRTEVRSKCADSHLGHLFDDGPGPTGQRFCINSASLKFIPVAELEAKGYGQYKALFESAKK